LIKIKATKEELDMLKKPVAEVTNRDGSVTRTSSYDLVTENLIRRWKKQVKDSNLLYECKRREFFRNKAEKRREKAKQAKIRRKMEEKFAKKYSVAE